MGTRKDTGEFQQDPPAAGGFQEKKYKKYKKVQD